MQAVGQAVEELSAGPDSGAGLARVLDAIAAWQASKNGRSARWEQVQRLERRLRSELERTRSAAPSVSARLARPLPGPATPPVVQGFAGAAGFEAELPDYGMIIPRGMTSEDIGTVVTGDGFELCLDSTGYPVLEFVSSPIRVLPGSAYDGRADRSTVFAALEDVLTRLGAARPNAPLTALFPSTAGYTVHADAEPDVRFGGRQTTMMRPKGMNLHYTVGVPTGGLTEFLTHVLEHARAHGGVMKASSEHLRDALVFGSEVASDLPRWAAARPQPAPRATEYERTALEGFMALTYAQIAAVAQYTASNIALTKNFAAVTSRMSLGGIRADLGPTARAYLDANAHAIRRQFTERFRDHIGETSVSGVLDRFVPGRSAADDGQGAPTIGDYLDNALMETPARPLTQNDALGVRTHYQSLDRNPDQSGTPRIDPGLVLLELRTYGERVFTVEGLEAEYGRLESLALDLYKRARAALGLRPVGLLPFAPVAGAEQRFVLEQLVRETLGDDQAVPRLTHTYNTWVSGDPAQASAAGAEFEAVGRGAAETVARSVGGEEELRQATIVMGLEGDLAFVPAATALTQKIADTLRHRVLLTLSPRTEPLQVCPNGL